MMSKVNENMLVTEVGTGDLYNVMSIYTPDNITEEYMRLDPLTGPKQTIGVPVSQFEQGFYRAANEAEIASLNINNKGKEEEKMETNINVLEELAGMGDIDEIAEGITDEVVKDNANDVIASKMRCEIFTGPISNNMFAAKEEEIKNSLVGIAGGALLPDDLKAPIEKAASETAKNMVDGKVGSTSAEGLAHIIDDAEAHALAADAVFSGTNVFNVEKPKPVVDEEAWLSKKEAFRQKLIKDVLAKYTGFKFTPSIKLIPTHMYDVKNHKVEVVQGAATWIDEYFDKNLEGGHTLTLFNYPNGNVVDRSMKNGVLYNDTKFSFSDASTSKLRQGRNLFTKHDKQEVFDTLHFYSDEFKLGKEAQIPKACARPAQQRSTGELIGAGCKHGIEKTDINVPGMEGVTYEEIAEISVNRIKDIYITKDGKLTTDKNEGFAILTDGQAIGNMAFAMLVQKKKRMKNKVTIVQFRCGSCKGIVVVVPNNLYADICKYQGVECDLNRPTVLAPDSVYKYEPGIDIWPFVVLQVNRKPRAYERFNYQHMNALATIGSNRNLVRQLANETYDKLSPRTAEQLINLFKMFGDEESDSDRYTNLMRIVEANPQLAAECSYVITKVHRMLKDKISEIGVGKIFVRGSVDFMIIDPFVYAGVTRLKAGTCFWGSGFVGTMLGHFRNPLMSPAEARKQMSVDADGFGYLKCSNVTVFNAYDRAWEWMGGADFDGDKCLTTCEQRIVGLIIDSYGAIERPKYTVDKQVLTWDHIRAYIVKTWENNCGRDSISIGTITNAGTRILEEAHEKDSMDALMAVMEDINKIARIQGVKIDAAKTGVEEEMPQEYLDGLLPEFLTLLQKTMTPEKTKPTNGMLGELYRMSRKAVDEFLLTKPINKAKTPNLIALADPSKFDEVFAQVKALERRYAKEIKQILDYTEEDNRSKIIGAMAEHYNTLLQTLVAHYDLLTVAACAIRATDERSFAFVCFPEGVVAAFSAVDRECLIPMDRHTDREVIGEVEVMGVKYKKVKVEGSLVKAQDMEKSVEAMKGEYQVYVMGVQYNDTNTAEEFLNACKASDFIARTSIKNFKVGKRYTFQLGEKVVGVIGGDGHEADLKLVGTLMRVRGYRFETGHKCMTVKVEVIGSDNTPTPPPANPTKKPDIRIEEEVRFDVPSFGTTNITTAPPVVKKASLWISAMTRQKSVYAFILSHDGINEKKFATFGIESEYNLVGFAIHKAEEMLGDAYELTVYTDCNVGNVNGINTVYKSAESDPNIKTCASACLNILNKSC